MTSPITDAAVEIAARTVHDADWRGPDEPSWDELSDDDTDSYRTYVRKILAVVAHPLIAAELRNVAKHYDAQVERCREQVGYVNDALMAAACWESAAKYAHRRANELEGTTEEGHQP